MWEFLLAALDAAVDDEFAEGFVFQPMRKPDRNARAEPDPERAEMPFDAVFDDRGVRAGQGNSPASSVTPDRGAHSSARAFVSLPVSVLPYTPRQGDHLVRRRTGATYEVSEALPDGQSRVRLHLRSRPPAA